MSHVAWSVCLSVCVLGTRVNCARTAEPIEMPFGGGGPDSCGFKEPLFNGGQERTNPFTTTRGDKTTMRHLAKLLWTVATVCHSCNFYHCDHYEKMMTECTG